MKFLRRLSVAALAGLMAFSTTACNNKKDDTDDLFVYDDYSTYLTLGDYKNIEIELASPEVTDEEVTDYINSKLLDKNVIYKAGDDRTVENGDIANIDYVGKIGDVQFTTASGYNLKIGSGAFIPGFEDGLVGAKNGQKLDVKLKFPASYGGTYTDADGKSQPLANADAVFTVTINYFGKSVVGVNKIIDRKVVEGDVVNIDFVGYIDGEEFDGGSSSNYDLTIGSGGFIDGFEDGLIDAQPATDELVELKLKFPDTYVNNPDLAGKDVVFKVKVNYIVEYVYPELTDEMANQLSTDYTTAEKYKKATADSLLETEEGNYNNELLNKIWEKIEEICPEKNDAVPQKEIDYVYNKNIDYFENYVQEMFGVSLEEYISEYYVDETIEDFKDEVMEDAKTYVRQMLIVCAIAKNENIEVLDDEYNKYLQDNYQANNYTTPEEMENAVGKVSIKNRMLQEKVFDYLNSVVKVVEPKTE